MEARIVRIPKFDRQLYTRGRLVQACALCRAIHSDERTLPSSCSLSIIVYTCIVFVSENLQGSFCRASGECTVDLQKVS